MSSEALLYCSATWEFMSKVEALPGLSGQLPRGLTSPETQKAPGLIPIIWSELQEYAALMTHISRPNLHALSWSVKIYTFNISVSLDICKNVSVKWPHIRSHVIFQDREPAHTQLTCIGSAAVSKQLLWLKDDSASSHMLHLSSSAVVLSVVEIWHWTINLPSIRLQQDSW